MATRPNVWSGEEDVAVGRAADTEARAGRRDVKRMLMIVRNGLNWFLTV